MSIERPSEPVDGRIALAERAVAMFEDKSGVRLVVPWEVVTAGGLLVSSDEKASRPIPTRAPMRIATRGIYLVRGLPRDLRRAARVRAVSEGTTLCHVLREGPREYAAGTWTPQRSDNLAGLKSPSDRSHDLDPV